jgi:hypothetical protein
MAGTKRLIKNFVRLVSPTFVLAFVAIMSASLWLVHETSKPGNSVYLVTLISTDN